MIKLRIFKWGIILDHPGKSNVITKVVIGGRQEYHIPREKRQGQKQKSERREGATLPALKMEGTDQSRNVGRLQKPGKVKEMDSHLQPPEGT